MPIPCFLHILNLISSNENERKKLLAIKKKFACAINCTTPVHLPIYVKLLLFFIWFIFDVV